MSVIRAVILGAPGSGKGTISNRIVKEFGLKHIASGDLLRSHVTQRTEFGVRADRYMKEGQLVPDELILSLINNHLRSLGTVPWLLDGFPRTGPQAGALQKFQPIDLAINLDIPAATIVERIKGRWTHLPSGRIYHVEFNPPKKAGIDDITGEKLVQRDDDKPETVQRRLDTYNKTITPVVEFYRKLGILKEFHGTETNVIWPKLKASITPMFKK